MARKALTRVVIVGAGPVGLLTALMLGRCGVEVDVLEAALEIDARPRGAAYGPPAVRFVYYLLLVKSECIVLRLELQRPQTCRCYRQSSRGWDASQWNVLETAWRELCELLYHPSW